jgi:hypothetical protein
MDERAQEGLIEVQHVVAWFKRQCPVCGVRV